MLICCIHILQRTIFSSSMLLSKHATATTFSSSFPFPNSLFISSKTSFFALPSQMQSHLFFLPFSNTRIVKTQPIINPPFFQLSPLQDDSTPTPVSRAPLRLSSLHSLPTCKSCHRLPDVRRSIYALKTSGSDTI